MNIEPPKIKVRKVLFQRPLYTLPNFLCLVRLGLLPVVLHYLGLRENLMALIVFAIASATDAVDGFLARRFKQKSEFGKIFDPFVDKTNVILVLAYLTYRNFQDYEFYPLILTFGTGFMLFISLVYLIALPVIVKKTASVPTSNLPGKITTNFMLAAVVLYMLELHPWADAWMVLTLGMTIASAVIYFLRDFRRRHKTAKIGWANRITLLRIVLSPLFLLVFFSDGNNSYDDNILIFKTLALLMVIALGVSDKVDGMLARTRQEISDFGKLLDPFADKIAFLSIFLCFIATGWAEVWMVILIYYREATVSFLRTLAATNRIVLAAMPSGKIKTAIQVTVVITLLSLSFLREVADVTGLSVMAGTVFDAWDYLWQWVPQVFMMLVTLVTLLSGLDYLWKNRKVIKAALQVPITE